MIAKPLVCSNKNTVEYPNGVSEWKKHNKLDISFAYLENIYYLNIEESNFNSKPNVY